MKIIPILFLLSSTSVALAAEPTNGTLIELSGIGAFVLLCSAYTLRKGKKAEANH